MAGQGPQAVTRHSRSPFPSGRRMWFLWDPAPSGHQAASQSLPLWLTVEDPRSVRRGGPLAFSGNGALEEPGFLLTKKPGPPSQGAPEATLAGGGTPGIPPPPVAPFPGRARGHPGRGGPRTPGIPPHGGRWFGTGGLPVSGAAGLERAVSRFPSPLSRKGCCVLGAYRLPGMTRRGKGRRPSPGSVTVPSPPDVSRRPWAGRSMWPLSVPARCGSSGIRLPPSGKKRTPQVEVETNRGPP